MKLPRSRPLASPAGTTPSTAATSPRGPDNAGGATLAPGAPDRTEPHTHREAADVRLDHADRFHTAVEAMRGHLLRHRAWCSKQANHVGLSGMKFREYLEVHFVPRFVQYSDEANQAWIAAPPGDAPTLKAFSRDRVHDLLLESPLMRRALDKPRGYPGDFKVMEYIYNDRLAGDSPYARSLTLAVTSTGQCAAVRARKDWILRRIVGRLRGALEPVRLLCVASGPAQEISELARGSSTWPSLLVDCVLIDKDPEALAAARAHIEAIDLSDRQSLRVQYVCEDVMKPQLDAIARGGKFDLVFASGLFDYFSDRVAENRIRALAGCARAGGEVLIGNMAPHGSSRWLMEAHLDWLLKYRTYEEIVALGDRAVPTLTRRVSRTASDINPFLVLRA